MQWKKGKMHTQIFQLKQYADGNKHMKQSYY